MNIAVNAVQMLAILSEAKQKHGWPMFGRGIKYIDFHYANSGGEIFTVNFRTILGDKQFSIVNRKEEDVVLYDEIMSWLKEGDCGNRYVGNTSADNVTKSDRRLADQSLS